MFIFNKKCEKFFVWMIVGILTIIFILPAIAVTPPYSAETIRAEELFKESETLYSINGDSTKAIENLNTVAEIFTKQADWENLAGTQSNLGKIYLDTGDNNKALENWELSESNYKKSGNLRGVTRSQIYQAKVLQANGAYSRSCRMILSAIAPKDNLGCEDIDKSSASDDKSQLNWWKIRGLIDKQSPELEVLMWRGLGDILRNVGQLDYSEEALRKGIVSVKSSGGDLHEDLLHLSLANTLRAQGNLDRDRNSTPSYKYVSPWAFYKQSKENKRSNKISEYKFNNAIQEYQFAASTSNDESIKIEAQFTELNLVSDLGNANDAKRIFLDIQTNLKDDLKTKLPINTNSAFLKISLAKDIGKLYFEWPNEFKLSYVTSVLESVKRDSRKIKKSDRILSYYYGTLGSLFESCYLNGNICGLSSLELLNKKSLEMTQLALIKAQSLELPDLLYQWHWQLGRIHRKRQQRSLAEGNYRLAINYIKSVRNSLLLLNTDFQFSFRDSIEPIYREFIAYAMTNEDGFYSNDIFNAVNELQLSELSNFAKCKITNVESLTDVVAPNTAMIYLVQQEEDTSVFYRFSRGGEISKDRNKTKYNIPSGKLNDSVIALRQAINRRNKSNAVRLNAIKLYNWIIKPIEKDLKDYSVNNLVFVLDGPIRNIPMSLLYDEKAPRGKNYMIDKGYATTVVPNTNFLAIKSKLRNSNILIGGSDFTEKNKNTEKWDVIKNLREELDEISKISGSPTPLINKNFTQSNISSKLRTGDFSAVHFKTHGEYSTDPEKTFLVAYNGEKIKGKDLNDMISAGSKNGVNPLDLIVLSACKSAQGDNRAILGLAGIAVRAGASSVLSTAWSVEPETTSSFMIQFYKALSIPGTTKAQAVLKAQKFVKDEMNKIAPHDWASYVLVGNWR